MRHHLAFREKKKELDSEPFDAEEELTFLYCAPSVQSYNVGNYFRKTTPLHGSVSSDLCLLKYLSFKKTADENDPRLWSCQCLILICIEFVGLGGLHGRAVEYSKWVWDASVIVLEIADAPSFFTEPRTMYTVSDYWTGKLMYSLC